MKPYQEAFIHKSAAQAYGGICQERMEHLGDAVLSLCVTHILFMRFPFETEGVLTRIRTRLVNGKTLAEIGRSMRINDILITGGGVSETHMKQDKMYEDTLEALIAAVYLDQGLQITMQFVANMYDTHTDFYDLMEDTNYKDMLRKATSKSGMQALSYDMQLTEGLYVCRITAGGVQLAVGEGTSKKAAEMEAAHNAILLHYPQTEGTRIA